MIEGQSPSICMRQSTIFTETEQIINHVVSSKTFKKGQNSGIKTADHKILKSRRMKFTNIDI
jgi:hypothetical protein